MNLEIVDGPAEAARRAARVIARHLTEQLERRERVTLAVSGGSMAGPLFDALAGELLRWSRVVITQVDERIAPDGHPDRNFTTLDSRLLQAVPVPLANIVPMPAASPDPGAAAVAFEGRLETAAGRPIQLDVVHLGLGADGHTASLMPDDPVLDVFDRDIALTGRPYQGRRRMTMTYPVLERARFIVWLVTGADKADVLARLVAGDESIPAGRVRASHGCIVADTGAAAAL